MLGLAGAALIFFTAAQIVVCFGFVVSTAGILAAAEQCLQSLKVFSTSLSLPTRDLAGCKLEGGKRCCQLGDPN